MTGYSVRSEKADIDRLESIQTALQAENENLIKQLEKEHEYTEAAQNSAAKTQTDLVELENRYADAIAELNTLQLQQFTYDTDDTSALSEDAEPPVTIPQSAGKCAGEDKAKFQQLYEKQLMISKDCDINATYLNNLIEWYSSISKE